MEISKLSKSVLTFLLFGVAAGLALATVTTRPAWQSLWFSRSEWWIVPSWRYWFLAQTLFVVAILGAYLWARSKTWLPPQGRSRFRVWALVLATGGIALILWQIYKVPALALPINFLLLPAALVILLYVFSGRFDGVVAILIVLTNTVVTLLASIPDLLLTSSVSLIAFQSLKTVLTSGTLAALTGLWLARRAR